MGHRVMEKHNLHGKTAARHLVPRSVKRSRKRALRIEAKSMRTAVATPKPMKPARVRTRVAPVASPQRVPSPERRSWKQVLGIAAKAPEPVRVETPPLPVQTPGPSVPQTLPATPTYKGAEYVRVTEDVQIAAQTSSAPPPTAAQPPAAAQPPKAAKPPTAAKPPKAAKSFKARKPGQQPDAAREAEERLLRTDLLEDGVVEWGIKREGDSESGT